MLSNCWPWLSQYGPHAVCSAAWDSWTLGQCTDGAVGPNSQPVAGVGACDRNTFNGTLAERKTFWGVGNAWLGSRS